MSRTWTEIDLAVLRRNLLTLQRCLRKGTEFILSLQADGYGHGAAVVGQCAWSAGVKTFLADSMADGIQLRQELPDARILVASPLAVEDVDEALNCRLVPVISNEFHAHEFALRAVRRLQALQVHACIDTGIGYGGIAWEEAPEIIARLARTPGLKLTGLTTILAASDADDQSFAEVQFARFYKVVTESRQRGTPALMRYLSDSGSLLQQPAWDLDAVRIGMAAYGYPPCGRTVRHVALDPCLHWKAHLAQVRSVGAGFPVGFGMTYTTAAPTRLGSVPVGYGDGYLRRLGGQAVMLTGGRRCPVLGRPALHESVIDLGPDSTARAGDEVVLLGSQRSETVTAADLATWSATSVPEFLAGLRIADRRSRRGR